MPGTKLREGSAFGSFSFITKDSEEWSIYAGIPCKFIKKRERRALELEDEMMV